MDKIVLTGNTKSIQVNYDMDKVWWCEFYLLDKHHAENNILLGCGELKKLKDPFLLRLVSKSERKYFVYDNRKMFTVMTLMGPHMTIAAEELENDGLRLNFMELEDNYASSITLSKNDIERWKEIISTIPV